MSPAAFTFSPIALRRMANTTQALGLLRLASAILLVGRKKMYILQNKTVIKLGGVDLGKIRIRPEKSREFPPSIHAQYDSGCCLTSAILLVIRKFAKGNGNQMIIKPGGGFG